MVVLAIDYSNFCFYYSFWFAPCKAIWIPESRSFLTVESGIQQTLLWNPGSYVLESGIQLKQSVILLRIGIRIPGSTNKDESGMHYLESRIHRREIQKPRLSTIPLHGAT